MSATYTEARLGQAAGQFMKECLASGNTLARLVLETLRLEQSEITTFLPLGTAPESVQDFGSGGKLPAPPSSEWKYAQAGNESLRMVPVPNTDAELGAKIKEYLLSGNNRVCVLEDALKKPSDPVLSALTTKYATYGSEVYHLLLQEHAQDDSIFTAMKSAKSIPTFIGVMTSCARPRELATTGEISVDELRELAKRAEIVFVGAYDGEGYLLWRRRS